MVVAMGSKGYHVRAAICCYDDFSHLKEWRPKAWVFLRSFR